MAPAALVDATPMAVASLPESPAAGTRVDVIANDAIPRWPVARSPLHMP
ncbi:MAG: hypothetical protein IT339_02540 [Thermomicrobiales bacterium]|nr:hypothetical protein [Thermomicrobiales bacterium]